MRWLLVVKRGQNPGCPRFKGGNRYDSFTYPQKETHDRILRIVPPLVIQREEIDWACERFQKYWLSARN